MQRKKILLINSSQVLMTLTKKILERTDYSVRCAVGIAGAREQFMDFTPDGIIMENDLPDGNGLDYCRELRKKSDIPIMITSNAKEDELFALQAGANDFLKKPYDQDILTARIGIMVNATSVYESITDTGDNSKYYSALSDKTKPMAEYWQTVSPTATAEQINQVKKKRIPKIRQVYMTTAACFLFMFIGIGVMNVFNNQSPYVDISDGQVPLAGLPFLMEENAKPYTGTEQGIKFPDIENITVPANSTNIAMLLFNPKDNLCYFSFEIVLSDTGESLYSSGMIEPGKCIDEITLSRGLAKGEYKAYIKIRTYALEDFTAMSEATITFYVTAD